MIINLSIMVPIIDEGVYFNIDHLHGNESLDKNLRVRNSTEIHISGDPGEVRLIQSIH